MKREFYGCIHIASLLMFGTKENKSQPEIAVTRSGKRYIIDTRKRVHGKYLKKLLETKYSPLLSESKSERDDSLPDKSQVTSQYSPS